MARAWLVPLLVVASACNGVRDDGDVGSTETGTGTTSETGESETGESETETGESETGEPPGVCGDGVVDVDEACDDANTDDADGCLQSCEIGPCGFEWFTRELVMTGSGFAYHVPFAIIGDELVVAHQLGEGGLQTGLVHADKADGLASASTELVFDAGPPEVHALIAGVGGELYLSRVGAPGSVEIHRLDTAGNVEWSISRPSLAYVPDLQLSPGGELLLVNSIDNGPMDDQVELAALDPQDGAELWAHAFGGPIAPNGFSTDRAAALALADDGRVFVAYDQYDDWDTINPAVIAFGPDGDPTPLWTSEVLDDPGRKHAIRDLAWSDAGVLAVSFQRDGGTQPFWIAVLDDETGAVEWAVQRDDFELPNTLSVIRGLAITSDRVVATGTWKLEIAGTDVFQAYALGLDLGGNFSCLGTLDDYDAATNFSSDNFLPMDMHVDGDGLLVSGYVYGRNTGNVDLLLARVRL